MKKYIIFFATLILSLSFLNAAVDAPNGEAGSNTATIDGSTNVDGLSSYLEATFNMNAEENQKVVIGFINNEEYVPESMGDVITEETDADSVVLTADPDSGTAKYGVEEAEYIAVFYQIQYNKELDVVLGLEDDLALEDGTKLGWKITAGSDSAESPSFGKSGEGEIGEGTKITLDLHHPSTSFTTIGAKDFSIETDKYVGKPTGLYTGYITATVDVGE